MPFDIAVGPPVLTINHSSTVMVTRLDGGIADQSEQGIFAQDTRFVSFLAYYANGVPWALLTSSAVSYYAARIYLVNRALATEQGGVSPGVVALQIDRTVDETIHEDLLLTNYSLEPLRFNLEIAVRSDFADIFEVKAHRFVRRGRIETRWDETGRQLYTTYANGDFHRGLIYRIAHGDASPIYANGRMTFPIAIEPGQQWHACCEYILRRGKPAPPPTGRCPQEQPTSFTALQRRWREQTATLTSTNDDLARLYRQSVKDLGALRLYEHDISPDLWMPAAGVPWFVTIFGRDSLISGLQCLPVNADMAKGALTTLATYQADRTDDWRDAEPGKILHELRFGELAHFNQTPHTPYYGTADATPLFLIALHELWQWTGDDALLRQFRETACRCLEWIDRSGDLDGDGFQEYQTRSPQGYENMGWKDSRTAVVYPDGSQVKSPKALCELQGYVFDAWLRTAEVFDRLGEADRATELRQKAARLQAQFEDRFWCAKTGFYAFALDPDKRPVATIASNAGQLLWTGMVRPDRAARVVARLQEPDMWSGWGIRTLSARNPAYNPFAYQRGSVWPHDNGIIALGMKRYGFAADAARLAQDILRAGRSFIGFRMPELYAGIERRPASFPVQYLGANVPQAWAAGSVFHLVRALTGLHAAAAERTLYVDPVLPAWLADLAIHRLKVGSAEVDFRCWREGDRTRWDASVKGGDLEVKHQAWTPWQVPGAEEQKHAA
jgi:glycogen debranching enzyme